MKAVLISIQPKWCELIASGKKTVEVRKTKPKLETPFKCYIYETQGKTETPWIDEDGHVIFKGRGQVIGEFVCNKIEDLRYDALEMTYFSRKYRDAKLLDEEFFPGTQGTYQKAYEYCEGMSYGEEYSDLFYGWHISDLVIYDKPRALSEFFYACNKPKYTDCSVCLDHKENRCKAITRPTQSWCYVESEDTE